MSLIEPPAAPPAPLSALFRGWTLTQTEKTETAQTWTLSEKRSPDKALYLYRTWEAHTGRWRRWTGSAGVDTRAMIGKRQTGADKYGRPKYEPDTDESRAAEVAMVERIFKEAMGR